MSSPLEKMVIAAQEALIEQNETLRREIDHYRSCLQEAEQNAASEKKRLEAQIVELHQQNYALVDVNERLANFLEKNVYKKN